MDCMVHFSCCVLYSEDANKFLQRYVCLFVCFFVCLFVCLFASLLAFILISIRKMFLI